MKSNQWFQGLNSVCQVQNKTSPSSKRGNSNFTNSALSLTPNYVLRFNRVSKVSKFKKLRAKKRNAMNVNQHCCCDLKPLQLNQSMPMLLASPPSSLPMTNFKLCFLTPVNDHNCSSNFTRVKQQNVMQSVVRYVCR